MFESIKSCYLIDINHFSGDKMYQEDLFTDAFTLMNDYNKINQNASNWVKAVRPSELL